VTHKERIVTLLSAIQAMGLAPVVLTTNYDLVIETALMDCGSPRRWTFACPGISSPVPNEPTLGPGNSHVASVKDCLPIIKLHGSVNWFAFGDGTWEQLLFSNRIRDDEWGGRSIGGMPSSESTLRKLLVSDSYTNMYKTSERFSPAIIPPMLGKWSNSPIIANQWRAAIEAISQARRLWIIGYSFPETDTFMPRLLSQGLQGNQDLQEIVLFNVDDRKAWDQKIDRLFTPSVKRKLGYVKVESHLLDGNMSQPANHCQFNPIWG
jgi:hypothetical protein